jgi:hypothetical protein
MKRPLQAALSCLFFSIFIVKCAQKTNKTKEATVSYTQKDLKGQWSLIRIDTIIAKQSLEQYEKEPLVTTDYAKSDYIKPVNGILKCISGCSVPKIDIEFSDDSIFSYRFPNFLLSKNTFNLDSSNFELSLNKDTLYKSYLEETGLYLKEVYVRAHFDDTLSTFLKKYGVYLPAAKGTYRVVLEESFSIDYDSPYEYELRLPHKVPKTLIFTPNDLVEIAKNNFVYQMKTGNTLRPYELLWSDRYVFGINYICLYAKEDWYSEEDDYISNLVLFRKVE